MHSPKIGEDVWIVNDREIFDMIRDGRGKYSQQEVDKVALLSTEELRKLNDIKKVFPGAETKDVQ